MNKVDSGGGFSGRELIQAPKRQKIEFSFPSDLNLLTHIFVFACQGSPKDFQSITLVSKNWKEIARGDAFYKELHLRIAPEIFVRADFIKCIGGDPGEEFPIPLEYLVKFRSGHTLLTFAPKSLKFTQADGTVVEEARTLLNMGKWASNAKSGYQIGYHPNSYPKAFLEDRPIEENHWSFIEIDLIEMGKDFATQQKAVKDRGEDLAGLIDLTLALLTTYLKTGVMHISSGEKFHDHQWARVPETTGRYNLFLGYSEGGLYISHVLHLDLQFMGVVVARKSFAQGHF